jgi:hypothetical protein
MYKWLGVDDGHGKKCCSVLTSYCTTKLFMSRFCVEGHHHLSAPVTTKQFSKPKQWHYAAIISLLIEIDKLLAKLHDHTYTLPTNISIFLQPKRTKKVHAHTWKTVEIVIRREQVKTRMGIPAFWYWLICKKYTHSLVTPYLHWTTKRIMRREIQKCLNNPKKEKGCKVV